MSIQQELIFFAHSIDTISSGYKSWGKVVIEKIAIREGQFLYTIPAGRDLKTLTEADIMAVNTINDEDKMITAIFAKRSKINCIMITRQEYGSTVKEEIPPILDDQAQLLGVSVRIADTSHTKAATAKVMSALSSRFAAVCSDGRCICIGGTVDDAYIAAQLLEKTAKAFTEAKWLGGAKSINRLEAWAMQMYYQFKYAKEAKKNR
jgi:ribulose-5-phosphate 4-epimerase/fuculose-1-phosphate aldolase